MAVLSRDWKPSAVTHKIFFANVDKETPLVHFNPWHNNIFIFTFQYTNEVATCDINI